MQLYNAKEEKIVHAAAPRGYHSYMWGCMSAYMCQYQENRSEVSFSSKKIALASLIWKAEGSLEQLTFTFSDFTVLKLS